MTPRAIFLMGFGLGILIAALAGLCMLAALTTPPRERAEDVAKLYDRSGRWTS